MATDPDPEKLLRGWVRGPPPEWKSEKAYHECNHCNEKFERSHRHNCRLCGELFCSRCTGKFHLPTEFDPKGKTGPMRVCYGCRNGVLDKKKEAGGVGKGWLDLLPPSQQWTEDGYVRMHPPAWEERLGSSECCKCRELLKGKGHNCRACGRLTCSDCSSKMSVPDSHKKKKKPGDSRVCDVCRYYIRDGPCWDPTPLSHGARTGGAGGLISPRNDSSDDEDDKPMLARVGSGLQEDREALTKSPSGGLSGPGMTVRWQMGDHVLVSLTGQEFTQETPLASLHQLLLRKRPQLSKKRFQYLCRGKPVAPEHFDIFLAKHLTPVLYLSTDDRISVDMGHSPALMRPYVPTAAAAPAAVYAAPAQYLPPPSYEQTEPVGGFSAGFVSPNANSRALGGSRDSVSSQNSDGKAKVLCAVALYDFQALDDTQMPFTKGDLLTLLDKEDAEWWFASLDKKGLRGWIPASYVEEIPWIAPSPRPSVNVARPMLAAAAAAANKSNGFSYGAAASHSTLSPRGGQPTVSASAAPAVYTINTAVAAPISDALGAIAPVSPPAASAASTGQSMDDILRARAKMFKK